MCLQFNLDGNDLLERVQEAWEKGESRCGGLRITCRKKTKDSAVFLFEAKETLYQFPIPVEVLRIRVSKKLFYRF